MWFDQTNPIQVSVLAANFGFVRIQEKRKARLFLQIRSTRWVTQMPS